MKIKIEIGDEKISDFEKISNAIVRDLVNLRGMPTDDGQYMRTEVERLRRDDLAVEVDLAVCKVKCSRHEDF